MGVQDGAPYCRPSRGMTDTVESIRGTLNQKYPSDGPHLPYAGVDLSGWIVAALKQKQAVQQVFMEPPVPVSSAVDYIRQRADILIKNGFIPLFIFDGATNPAKKNTNDARSAIATKAKEDLEQMYANPNETDLAKLFKLQQLAVQVRKDVLYEVLMMAKEMDIPVIGSAFEADSQIIALGKQGIIDVAVTMDSDIPYQGMCKTIMRLSVQSPDGNCCLATFTDLLQKVKSKIQDARQQDIAKARKRGSRQFDNGNSSCFVRDLCPRDLSLFACLLGNDYVCRLEKHGPQKSLRKMYDYLQLECDLAKEDFIKDYVKQLPDGQRSRFFHAREHFHHGAAFIVCPKDDRMTPRQAFDAGPEHYDVELGSMCNCSTLLFPK